VQSTYNPLIVLIQFTTDGITFLVFVSYCILCRTIKALHQKSQCTEFNVTALCNSFPATGSIVLLLALSNKLSMNKHKCPVSSTVD